MPLTKNSSHLIHEGITKHTWSPNLDTKRYQATGTATYKKDAFTYGDTADTPRHTEYTYQHAEPQVGTGIDPHGAMQPMTECGTSALLWPLLYQHPKLSPA